VVQVKVNEMEKRGKEKTGRALVVSSGKTSLGQGSSPLRYEHLWRSERACSTSVHTGSSYLLFATESNSSKSLSAANDFTDAIGTSLIHL